MKYIEFCGLPGTGKSTAANKLVQGRDYITKEYNIKGFGSCIRHNIKSNICLLKFALPQFRELLNAYYKFYKSLNKKNIESIKFIIIDMSYALKSLTPNTNVVVSDQGWLQHLLSIAYDEIIDKKSLELLITEFYKLNMDYKVVFFESNINNVFESIKNRSNGHSRLDTLVKIDEERAKYILSIQKNNLNLIKGILPEKNVLVIEAYSNIDNIVDAILPFGI